MALKTDAVKEFLNKNTLPELAILYNHDMEVQVNVAQDNGERVDGDFKGRKWHGFSDGINTWKSFRVPWKANTEAEYNDSAINFDLALHAEAIGMTGWDWKAKVSRWVAYDFDSIIGHSDKHTKKLTQEQLDSIRTAVDAIEWITVRKSTAGKGLHLYVHLNSIPTANHNEHAALARSILGKLSALTGFDFQSKVDICGGNMWVWARKMLGTDGLVIIKQGEMLRDVPLNWRDHVKVITGQRRKNLPQNIGEQTVDQFDELTSQTARVPLDEGHKKLITWLKDNNALWWWDQDHHMLVSHTMWLQRAAEALQLRGRFITASDGKDLNTQNCFVNPLRKGAWVVRRFSPGCQEHESWEQDGAGWTRAYINKEPDLRTAARITGGMEDPSGGFVFREAEMAARCAEMLGTFIKVDSALSRRETKIKQHRDGRLIFEIKHEPHDRSDEMDGWLPKKGTWSRIYNYKTAEAESELTNNNDELLRHLVTESGEDSGWTVKSEGQWRVEPLTHIKIVLSSMGMKPNECANVLGGAIMKAWKLVNKPFQPEYTGNREWNRSGAQFRFAPSQSEPRNYPTWTKILNHCGAGLDDAVRKHAWCKQNGIATGGDYLKCWLASLVKEPYQPLPYLFFHSRLQNTGKSSFHEAAGLLLTKGYVKGEASLTNQQNFNGELEGAILCYVEEIDLRMNKQAYNRIKDWVTARELQITYKGDTPFHVPNTTHWIQVANDHNYCPIFPGDTRITMCHVNPIDPIDQIPKKKLIPLLEKEAPDFLAELLSLELPDSNDRLNVPVIETEDKRALQKMNRTPLEAFIDENCTPFDGQRIKFSDFYDKFVNYIDIGEATKWSKIRVGKELPPMYTKGRCRGDAQYYIGNIWWTDKKPTEPTTKKYAIAGDYMEPL